MNSEQIKLKLNLLRNKQKRLAHVERRMQLNTQIFVEQLDKELIEILNQMF